jgi:1-acyl-sn-glycerol-3-phosphate acyltransferase
MTSNLNINDVKEEEKRPKHSPGFMFYRFLRIALMPVLKILWPTKFVNRENVDKINGGLVICNHYTKVDGLIPTPLFKGEMHVLAKQELMKAGIGKWFLGKMGTIPVRRGEPDIDAVKAVLKVLKDDKKLLIFPEGTRNKEGTKDMGEFKEGTARFAIKTKKPLLPMIYYSSPKLFKKNYLYIGEPIYLDDFYSARSSAEYQKATQFVYDKMVETRALCDEYVAGLKEKRKSKDAK